MVKTSTRTAAVALGTTLLALALTPRAEAQPTTFCVRQASGVPGDSGIPKPWFPFGAPTSTGTPDDPRWVGASGHSVAEQGPAIAPVELRATWGNDGGQNYLYLSWKFYYTPALPDTAHVLHVVFTPPGASLDDAAARVVRLRFRGNSMTTGATYCQDPFALPSSTPCPDGTASGVYTQYKRWMDVLDDGGLVPLPSPDQCGEIIGGADFEAMAEAGTEPGVLPWMTESLRYWNINNRWTVEMRVPVMAAPRNLGDGVSEGTKISYQASVEVTPGSLAFHRWPRDERAEPDRKELACDRILDFPSHVVVDPAVVSPAPPMREVALMGGGPVGADPSSTACGTGVSIDWLDIGALDSGGNIGSIFNTTPDGGGVVRNTLVAQIQNNSPNAIADGAMTARFRIANWGSQVPASEAWTDVPVAAYDTDAGAWPPAEARNTGIPIPAGTTDRRIPLPWAMTDLQFCQYTADFSTTPAWTGKCEFCDANSDGDAGPADGVRVRSTSLCASVRSYHQCMSVELRGGNVDYDRRGVARNMDFASLSTDEKIAAIDLAGMPAAPGQTEWEVFLLAMPRNVPATVPPGSTGTSIIAVQAAAVVAAMAPAGGHGGGGGSGSGSGHQPPNPLRLAGLGIDLGKIRRPLPDIDGLPQVDQGEFDGYPPELRPGLLELHRVARIDAGSNVKAEALTVGLTQTFNGATVAQLVPTLDVYVYVRAKDGAKALSPLTSFVLFGHHEGALVGLRAGIDGAERVSPLPIGPSEAPGPRVYRVRIPVKKSVDVRPWMQALVAGETARVDDPNWGKPPILPSDGDQGKEPPCVEPPQGCCRCNKGKKCPPKTGWQMLGESVPFGIAAVIAGWRNRRRKKK